MIRVLVDGVWFAAVDHEGVVRLLLASDRLRRNKPLDVYMRRVAAACRLSSRDAKVRHDDARAFLRDLEREGFLLLAEDAA